MPAESAFIWNPEVIGLLVKWSTQLNPRSWAENPQTDPQSALVSDKNSISTC